MTSKASAPGTFNAEDRFHRFQSPLGGITLAASRRGLRGLWFEDQRHFPSLPTPFTDTADGVLIKAEQQVLAYLSGRRRQFDLILDLSHGTAFQQSVWSALLALPFGHTATYADLAAQLGRADAVRAVASAIGRNPVSVIVPCHRVLGSDGSLTGYAGGLERKIELLRIEGHHDLFG
ncbi:MAG: methylated-DNA--[protein]-cysteine S-methyltransferase [Xanthomonadales bacterium]|jgi:methylated-DNA-[protein]-cysteine S-methyltransferase|nr:methylated-DNA--[protein]-cysteine S-methyltransferase [Xanthomonadales bacterium]